MLTVSLVGKKFSCSIQLQISAESEGGGFELALNAGEKCAHRSQAISQVTANLNITIQNGCKNRVTKCQEMLMFLQEQAIPKTMNVMKVHMVSTETKHFQRDGLKLFNCIRPGRRERERTRDRSTSRDRSCSRGYSSDTEHQSKFTVRSRSTDSFISSSSNTDTITTPRLIRHQLQKAGLFREQKKRATSLERVSSSSSSWDMSGKQKELELDLSGRESRESKTSSHHARCLETREEMEKRLEKLRNDPSPLRGKANTDREARKLKERTRSDVQCVNSPSRVDRRASDDYTESSEDKMSSRKKVLTLELGESDQRGKMHRRSKTHESHTPRVIGSYRRRHSLINIPSSSATTNSSSEIKSKDVLLCGTEDANSAVKMPSSVNSLSSSSALPSPQCVVTDDCASLRAFARRITKAIINSAIKLHMDRNLMDTSSISSEEFPHNSLEEKPSLSNRVTKLDPASGKENEDTTFRTIEQQENEQEVFVVVGKGNGNVNVDNKDNINTEEVDTASISVATQTELPGDSNNFQDGSSIHGTNSCTGASAKPTSAFQELKNPFASTRKCTKEHVTSQSSPDMRSILEHKDTMPDMADPSRNPRAISQQPKDPGKRVTADAESHSVKLYDVYQGVKDRLSHSLALGIMPEFSSVQYPVDSLSNRDPLSRRASCGECVCHSKFINHASCIYRSNERLNRKPESSNVSSSQQATSKVYSQNTEVIHEDQRKQSSAVLPERLGGRAVILSNHEQGHEKGVITPHRDIPNSKHSWFVSLSNEEPKPLAKKETPMLRPRSSMYMRSISDQNERRRWKAAEQVAGSCDSSHLPETQASYRQTRCVSCPVLSEEDVVLESIESHHRDVCDTLSKRTWVVLRVQEIWRGGDPTKALMTCMELAGMQAVDVLATGGVVSAGGAEPSTKDNALFLNILQQLPRSCSSWSLGMCLLLLPRLKGFISTQMHSSHVCMACNILHVIVKKISGIQLKCQKGKRETSVVLTNCLSELCDIEKQTGDVLNVIHNKALTTITEDLATLRSVLSELLLALRTLQTI